MQAIERIKDGWKQFRTCSSDDFAKLIDHIDKLESEVERLRKDADRYRWLRENGDAGCTMKDGYGGQELKTNGYLDAAVDEAIAKAEEKNHDRP